MQWDFRRVFPKRVRETVNSCWNNLVIKVHTLKGDMFMYYLYLIENVFEASLSAQTLTRPTSGASRGLSVDQLRHILNIYHSYIALINVRYWIFRHSFLKHPAFPYFMSDSIENLYAGWKHVEVIWYRIPFGYSALIKIYNGLNSCDIFCTTQYMCLYRCY